MMPRDMATTDTRPPLRLTRSEAVNWTRFHPEDQGREIVIQDVRAADVPLELRGTPARGALGYNARGEWVWADEAEGRWPY